MTRILFVELLGGIGDTVLALPAIHALARSHHPAQVTVLTFRPGGELLAHDPLVHEVRFAPYDGAAASVAELLAGPGRRFDIVVSDTMYDGIDRLVERCDAPVAVANLWRSPPADELIDLRFLRLLHDDGLIDAAHLDLRPRITLTADEQQTGRRVAQALGARRPGVMLVPDAGMAIKRWPIGSFRRVAAEVVARGGAVVVPTGGAPGLAEQLVEGLPADRGAVLAPMALRAAAAVAAAVDLCVAGDTGLARIATAVGTPTVGLYGPSTASRFGLRPPGVNVMSPVPCPERRPNMTDQACWYSGRCIYPDRSSCMDDIVVREVVEAAAPVLAPHPPDSTAPDSTAPDSTAPDSTP